MKNYARTLTTMVALTLTAVSLSFNKVNVTADAERAELVAKENQITAVETVTSVNDLAGKVADTIEAVETVEDVIEPEATLKSVDEIAKEVLNGDWGNGETRFANLRNAGYDPEEVQTRVNELVDMPAVTADSGRSVAVKVPDVKETENVDPVQPVAEPTQAETFAPVAEQPAINAEYTANGSVMNYGYVDPGTGESTLYVSNPSYVESSINYSAPSTNGYGYTYPLNSADYLSPEYFYGKTITVGNYSATLVPYGGQPAIDAAGQCAAEAYERMTLVDHASQGFGAIKTNNVAYIGGQKFVKVSQYNNGTNTGDLILLDDGSDYAYASDPGLCMYTCNGWGGRSVTVTFWVPSN